MWLTTISTRIKWPSPSNRLDTPGLFSLAIDKIPKVQHV